MEVNGMKFSNVLIRIGLVLAIAVSLVLSYFIWTNDQRFDNTSSNTSSVKVEEQNFESLNNIALPTDVIVSDENGESFQIHDQTKNIPVEIFKELKKHDLSRITRSVTTKSKYLKMLKNDDYLQLAYPDKLTIDSFAKIYQVSSSNLKSDKEFNRLFIPLNDSKYIYLGSDENETMYRFKDSDWSSTKTKKLIKAPTHSMAVSLEKVGTHYTPFYLDSNKINIYSYLTSQQQESYFVSKLLGTSEIESKVTDDNATYTSGLYKRIVVDRVNDLVTYTNYADTTIPKKATSLFSRSFDYLMKSGLQVNNLRYFAMGSDYLSYRNYVEGLPVFLENDNVPALRVNFFNSGVNINFSNINLQIPIPADSQTVTLPKTSDVVANLLARGIKRESIQRIELGFTMSEDSSVDNLVNLKPTYYFEIYNEWKTYSEWETTELASFQNNVTGEE